MKVYKTNDYSLFKFLNGNRKVYKNHIKKLEKAILEKNMLESFPIIVNEQMFIIDGQHRYTVCVNNNLPIYYQIVTPLDLQDVQQINTSTKKWSLRDYVESYVELGREDYKTLLDFADNYNTSVSNAAYLLMGTFAVSGGGLGKAIKDGKFKVKSLKQAQKYVEATQALSVGFVSRVVAQREFVRAVIEMMKIKGFDLNKLVKKMSSVDTPIQRLGSVKQYLLTFEEIYNKRSRNKIEFLL